MTSFYGSCWCANLLMHICISRSQWVNTLRPRQNGCHFADDIFKGIFLSENVWILINISLKFVPKGPIDHIPALVQIMAWRRPADKPLSEPMVIVLLTHICVTRPQWVNEHIDSESNVLKLIMFASYIIMIWMVGAINYVWLIFLFVILHTVLKDL